MKWWTTKIKHCFKEFHIIESLQFGGDALTLCTKGNDEFNCGMFYTKAIANFANNNMTKDDEIACYGNRCQVKLNLEKWEEAIMDAQHVLSIEPNHPKAKFRLAKALIRIGDTSHKQNCTLNDEWALEQNQEQKSIQDIIEECARLEQEKLGHYD